MKRSLALWILVALAALPLFPVTAVPVDRQAALDSMVAAEKAFAKVAAEKGTRAAFIEYLADDSTIFAPGPVRGKETWKARPARPSFLSWYPAVAEISQAGDLGWDSGPWELRPQGKDDKTVLHGFFVSVWRKQADGSFKAEYDGGTSNDSPPAALTEVKIAKANPARVENPPAVDASAGQRALLVAEHDFAQAAGKGVAAAYGQYLAEDSRLYRDGAFPVISKPAILKSLAATKVKVNWVPFMARISSSGDLGYALSQGTLAANAGYFTHIWRKQGDAWKMVTEVFTPLPPPTPADPHKRPHP
ncbi:MAG: hypothetical protein QOF89_5533 [Acidobacteriota bacterium]|jgi:ketosteroid isomerase-like protein|nr:hypothetical protein [Acidobacteriota bacterium]